VSLSGTITWYAVSSSWNQMASVRGLLNIQSLNELTYEKQVTSGPVVDRIVLVLDEEAPKDRVRCLGDSLYF